MHRHHAMRPLADRVMNADSSVARANHRVWQTTSSRDTRCQQWTLGFHMASDPAGLRFHAQTCCE